MGSLRRLLHASSRRDAFDGAQQGRLFADWQGYIQSATQEMRYELRTLRGRSRELARNNPHMRKFINALTTNVVGPKGIRLQPTNLGRDGKRDRLANGLILASWQRWGQRDTCTLEKRLRFTDVERLVLATIAIDGEAFVREVPFADNPFGYALQLLDADLLDENYFVERGPNGNPIKMGVEVDRLTNAALGYWFWTRHPQDMTSGLALQRVFIPASEVHHLFLVWRIGQLRGIPWAAPAMKALRHLGGYVDNELVASRTSAAKMGFIEQSPADGASGPDPDAVDGEDEQAPYLEAAPGIIERLGPGEKFSSWNPEHPTGQFAAFLNAMLHFIAAGVNTAAVTLSGDLSQANYSSLREGKNTERDAWEILQDWFAGIFHEPIYSTWLPMARATGALALAGNIGRWLLHKWQARGWRWVDPLKDVQASERELALRLTTRTRLAAERGDDFEELLVEWKAEQELAAELGVDLPDVQPSPIAPGTYDSIDSGVGASGSEGAAGTASSGSGRARLVALRNTR
jgi:lambda family phage portal protein